MEEQYLSKFYLTRLKEFIYYYLVLIYFFLLQMNISPKSLFSVSSVSNSWYQHQTGKKYRLSPSL